MRVGNNHKGEMDGTITDISNLEIDLVVKSLKLGRNKPMCESHEKMIDELTLQFEAMLQEVSKIS